jgi:hypothetical protein
MKVGIAGILASLALLTFAAVPVGAADRCEFDTSYPIGWYPIRGGTTIGGKRLIGLVTRYWPNGVPVMDVVADAGDGTEETIATGEFDERRGRWRLESPFIPPDEAGLDLRLKRCKRFVGRLKLPGKPARRIVAVRATCGDGIVDARAGEDCEPGGAACAGGTCTDRCECHGSTGRLDATFGTDGEVTIRGPSADITCALRIPCPAGSSVASIIPADGGTMLVVGSAVTRYGRAVFLDRLRDDGTLDPSFSPSTWGEPAPLIDLMPDGRGIWVQSYPTGPFVRRFLADGNGDVTFVGQEGRPEPITHAAATADGGIVAVGDGTVTTWAADGAIQFVDLPAPWTAAAVDDTARILALRSDAGLRLGRFLVSGSPDPTFASGGPVCITATTPSTDVEVHPMNDGSTLVAVPTDAGYRIARVPPDGAGLDATCANEPPSFVAPIVPRLVQADGKYLGLRNGVLRLLSDGTPDLDFGRLGTIEVPAHPTALALDSNGRILVGRYSGPAVVTSRFVRRYLP